VTARADEAGAHVRLDDGGGLRGDLLAVPDGVAEVALRHGIRGRRRERRVGRGCALCREKQGGEERGGGHDRAHARGWLLHR
jgi:hypothetical protein